MAMTAAQESMLKALLGNMSSGVSPGEAVYRLMSTVAVTVGGTLLQVQGVAGTVIRIRRAVVFCSLGAAGMITLYAKRDSTAEGAVTGVAPTKTPVDSASPASVALIKTYATPTAGGTLVGFLSQKVILANVSATPLKGDTAEFSAPSGPLCVLRGAGDFFSIAQSFPSYASAAAYTELEWSESAT